ncbi:HEAT repeat domain-containing protein [Nocardiopsis sp. CC223A]|uniref:HEAT repeat domain-containing protein n=1 Tax=Nocardiopsis sp. CC223A TaxID=3044051 RepID=UPI00278BB8A7|nr:HEAT repeat domain-containing protein [Nocardiopsis sp. CC223A]
MSPTEPTRASATHLLSTVEPLSCAARTHALTGFARRHAGTPELSAVVRDLEDFVRDSGFAPHAQRAFASHLALVSRDLDAVARHLASPHPDLRRAALRAVRTLPVPDEAVPPVLHDAPTGLRRALYRTLFHARRPALADRLLPTVRRDHGAPEAAVLLPACSVQAVADHLPDLAHAVGSWSRLARRHPDTLVAYLRTLGDEPVRRALLALDPIRPAAVAELASGNERWRPHHYPHAARTRDGNDERFYPSRYPVTPYGDRSVRSLHRAMRMFPERARPVLRAMEPGTRARHLERFFADHHRLPFRVILAHLDLCPREAAERRARVVLAEIRRDQRWQHRHGDPHLDLDALAFLPYAEVADTLADAAASGDAARRARGLAALVTAAGRTGDPALLADVLLTRADRARAERDPVRRALLRSVAGLPVPLLGQALPALERLLVHTVQSRDAGEDTRRALRDIAIRLLRHPDSGAEARSWALDVYVRLVERFGRDGPGRVGRPRSNPPWWAGRRWNTPTDLEPHLDQVLPAGAETELYRRLAPVLDAARARGEHTSTVLVAADLGRRIRNLPELRAHLRSAVLEAEHRAVANTAARLYLSGPDAAARARDLVEAAPDTVGLPRVWPLLLRSQPTDTVLASLAAADPSRVPAPDRRAARHLPARLTAALADRLADIAADPAAGTVERERALLRLGDLPRTMHRLRPYLKGEDIVLREAALSALGRSGDRTLDLILRGADGPQSRAAGPALSRQALAASPTELGPALADTLLGPAKVTVRKAAARLLGHHRPPGAVGHLVRALDTEELHRDVRAAVVGALVRCLDDPAALPALARHAPSFTEAELHLALLAPGLSRCPPEHRAAMAALVGGLPEPDTHHWRLEQWTARWLPWGEPRAVDAVIDALCDMGVPFAGPQAEILALWGRGIALERRAEVFGRLLDLVPADGPPVPAPRGEDTPHRRLLSLLQRSEAVIRNRSAADRRAAEVLDLLESRDEYATEAARIIVERMRETAQKEDVRPEVFVGLVLRYLRTADRRGRFGREDAEAFAGALFDRYGRPPVEDGTVAGICAGLLDAAAREDPPLRERAGWATLAVVERATRYHGWADPWPALLTRVAELGDPALRAAARRLAAD